MRVSRSWCPPLKPWTRAARRTRDPYGGPAGTARRGAVEPHAGRVPEYVISSARRADRSPGGRRDHPDGRAGLVARVDVPVRCGRRIADRVARTELVPLPVQVDVLAPGQHQPELLALVPVGVRTRVVPGRGLHPGRLESAGEVRGQQLEPTAVVGLDAVAVQPAA